MQNLLNISLSPNNYQEGPYLNEFTSIFSSKKFVFEISSQNFYLQLRHIFVNGFLLNNSQCVTQV